MKTNKISFSDEEAEELRVLLEEAEGIPINYRRGMNEICYSTPGAAMELRILFLLDIKLTISRVEFQRQRRGTMTKVFGFLKDFCEQNDIQKIVAQSVLTESMVSWCKKNGFEPDPNASLFIDGLVLGDYVWSKKTN